MYKEDPWVNIDSLAEIITFHHGLPSGMPASSRRPFTLVSGLKISGGFVLKTGNGSPWNLVVLLKGGIKK